MKRIEEKSIHELGSHFELFVLKNVDEAALQGLVEKSIQYNVSAMVVSFQWAKRAKEMLKGTGIMLGGGGSFPFGGELPKTKELIASQCMEHGVEDIEIPINYNALLQGDVKTVEEEVRLVRHVTRGAELKFIIEVCMLSDDQIRQACQILIENEVDYIKSSTGQLQGPTLEQACIIVDEAKGTETKTKVSGVKFPKPQNALMYLMAGIDRIGTQDPFEVLEGIRFMRQRGIVPGSPA